MKVNPTESEICDWCVAYLAKSLKLPPERIDPQAKFARLGLDSAASVFLAFKAGLKLMVIKYVWATVGTVGQSCQSNRGWFFDRDTTLAQVGGPVDVWSSYSVDPRREFVRHYGGKLEDVPDFVAIGVMTDGDNSQSPAEADYADFVVQW